MMGRTKKGKQKAAALSVAALAVAGGGAAFAASGSDTPGQESQAIVSAAADDLGVTPAKLTAALKAALVDRVDAKLKAGTITEAEAKAAKAKINSDTYALFGGGLGGRHGGGGGIGHGDNLATAATYLGVTEAKLQDSLQSGSSLADVAKATSGKSVDGLVAALVKSETAKLAKAVAAGDLTAARQTEILANLEARVTNMVNGVRPDGGRGGRPDGPPGAGTGAAA